MKKTLSACFMIGVLAVFCSIAENASAGLTENYQRAHALYGKGEFAKALGEYKALVDQGVSGGALFYNIGNCYFKMGKIGSAILYYEKAKRSMPADGELAANLAYARSLVGYSGGDALEQNIVLRAFMYPAQYVRLNTLAYALIIVYLTLTMLAAVCISRRDLRGAFAIPLAVLGVAFVFISVSFALKWHDEVVVTHAVIVTKEADARYEPIDKATSFYKLQEGNEVLLLETRNDWCRVMRLDGKIGWVLRDSIEVV